jgi:hypothetical protein
MGVRMIVEADSRLNKVAKAQRRLIKKTRNPTSSMAIVILPWRFDLPR